MTIIIFLFRNSSSYSGHHIYDILTRIPQINCQFDDVLGRFCYKNQCNTIITTGKPPVTRRVNPEGLIHGLISTVA